MIYTTNAASLIDLIVNNQYLHVLYCGFTSDQTASVWYCSFLMPKINVMIFKWHPIAPLNHCHCTPGCNCALVGKHCSSILEVRIWHLFLKVLWIFWLFLHFWPKFSDFLTSSAVAISWLFMTFSNWREPCVNYKPMNVVSTCKNVGWIIRKISQEEEDGSSPVPKKEIAIVSIREIPLKPQKWWWNLKKGIKSEQLGIAKN